MHDIEPFFSWRDYYISSQDQDSPFYGREYDEFYFTNKIYNYYIHPQWDSFESPTLFTKILYVDYDKGACIFEFIGEWNDCIHNDIMLLKRNILEPMMDKGIFKFIFIVENVLNFHASDDLYYEELREDLKEESGWLILLNLQAHVESEMCQHGLHYHMIFGGKLNELSWRAVKPTDLIDKLSEILNDSPQLLKEPYE